jgi:isoleucyl-tRNA synthetase
LRWLLGSLDGFSEEERVGYDELPELERYILHRLAELGARVKRAAMDYDWTGVVPEIHHFCASDLSAFYFDIRKDSIYCDRPDELRRRAARTVLDELHLCLCTWLAPVLCFTAEEAWAARYGDESSVHQQQLRQVSPNWRDEKLAIRWSRVRFHRGAITVKAEEARRDKGFGTTVGGSSLAMHLNFRLPYDQALDYPGAEEPKWAEIAIVSSATVERPMLGRSDVQIIPAEGQKCARCWRVLPEVGTQPTHPTLCLRCTDAVESGLVGQPREITA